jgi:hypothetical protein
MIFNQFYVLDWPCGVTSYVRGNRTLVLGRGKLIASPSKSTPGAGSTPTRRNTTTTTTINNNNTNKNKKPLHDDDKKKTQHDEEENDEEELQEKAKEEKMKKKKKKRGGKEEAEVEKEKTTTTQTQKTKKRKREAEKRSPPKSKRKGRHLAREEEGSDDDELSREDSFDLNGTILRAQRYTRHNTTRHTRVRSRLTFAPREKTLWRTSTAPWWRRKRSHTPRRPPQVVRVRRRHRPSHTSHCVRDSDIRFFTFHTHAHTHARTHHTPHARHTQGGR